MAKRDPRNTESTVSESLLAIVDRLAQLLLIVGGLAFLGGIAVLLINYFAAPSSNAQVAEQALQNVRLFKTFAVGGAIAMSLGAAWVFWGEEVLGPILILLAGGLLASPWYMPLIAEQPGNSAVTASALEAMGRAGTPLAVVGVVVILLDLVGRVRLRSMVGTKADQLQYGRGIREERDIRNVFMGKCWQLPYCRKFVRERCPIYHARRTCWKERVGCMCEESVIKNAMEGKVIPKDIVAASKFIPRVSSLTPEQKADRCRQCVIYNEHQKHKYRLLLPLTFLAVIGIYFLIRTPMLEVIKGFIGAVDRVLNAATLSNPDAPGALGGSAAGMEWFPEFVFAVIAFIVLAYLLRAVEYLVFKLKV